MENEKYKKAIAAYLADKTLTLREVASQYHVHRNTLGTLLKARNQLRRKNGENEYKQAILEYFKRPDATLSEIVSSQSLSPTTFRKYVRAAGLTIRPRRTICNPDFFDLINSEAKAYWLGFFCADGHLYKSGRQCSIQLAIKDEEHLNKFASIFGRTLLYGESYDERTDKSYKYCRCILSSKKLCNSLRLYGLTNDKTKTLGASVFGYVPAKLKHHFVRGYFDGDGCISKHHENEFSFSMISSEPFLLQLQKYIADEVGLVVNPLMQNGTMWVVQWGGNWQLIKIREWLYRDATVWMDRKRTIFNSIRTRLAEGSSKYRGVSWSRQKKKWWARIVVEGKRLHLGFFETEKHAAAKYDHAVRKYGMPGNQSNNVNRSLD